MSRSGYCDEIEDLWAYVRYRGALIKSIRGKRGQDFLKEMLIALDSLPEKKLIYDKLVSPAGEVCAIGSVMASRGIDSSDIDAYDAEKIAKVVGISETLVREIEYTNDDQWGSDEDRFRGVRKWIVQNILPEKECNETKTA